MNLTRVMRGIGRIVVEKNRSGYYELHTRILKAHKKPSQLYSVTEGGSHFFNIKAWRT